MGTFLIITAIVLVAALLFKPLCYLVAALVFIFKTFGKALLFYVACIACYFFTRWIGLDTRFPSVTTSQVVWCVIFAFLTPIYFSIKKSKK